jgi:hypothetical protein
MKIVPFILICFFANCALATDPEPRVPPLVGKSPRQAGGPMQFGARKNGIRIGLSKPKDTYRLNQRINIWIAFETDRLLPEGFKIGVRRNFLSSYAVMKTPNTCCNLFAYATSLGVT